MADNIISSLNSLNISGSAVNSTLTQQFIPTTQFALSNNAPTTGSPAALLGTPVSQTTSSGFSSTSLSSPASATAPTATTTTANVPDIRIRIRAQPTPAAGQTATNVTTINGVYGAPSNDNIMSILYETNGVVFPYTPQISQNFAAEYRTADLVHSNYDINTYTKTPSPTIGLNGKFTIQNENEAKYVLAVIHFFRTVTKMHFGQTDPLAGLPPPVLLFSGYGNYMFNDLKVIIKSFSTTFDESCDYITLNLNGNQARMPVLLNVQVEMGVQQTPKSMRTNFNLDKFRTGALMTGNNKGWI